MGIMLRWRRPMFRRLKNWLITSLGGYTGYQKARSAKFVKLGVVNNEQTFERVLVIYIAPAHAKKN